VSPSSFTPKGTATRARIIEATADLLLAHGTAATSLDDIRAKTRVSKSQLFHYFPAGKTDLIAAVALFQGERVLDAQRPHIDQLDSWASWQRWRDAVVGHYSCQPYWGCPIGTLAHELLSNDPEWGAQVASVMDRWRGYLAAGLHRMRASGLLCEEAAPEQLATAVFAALQGGLLLAQTAHSIAPLEMALDHALVGVRAWRPTLEHSASSPRRGPST
jgi:AcrR family transcriptional regulator